MKLPFLFALLLFVDWTTTRGAHSFLSSPTHPSPLRLATTCSTRASSYLTAASKNNNNNNSDEEDLQRWSRSSRAAGINDRVVELKRPLGVVLNEDDNGNVYVETVAPRGNAARTGMVQEGDVVTMCSATFGDQMWSTRGVGLTRVLAAIRVRAGPTVKLVLENTKESKRKATLTTKQLKAMEDARKTAQAKKDKLLQELEQDEEKLKKKKFLGLF